MGWNRPSYPVEATEMIQCESLETRVSNERMNIENLSNHIDALEYLIDNAQFESEREANSVHGMYGRYCHRLRRAKIMYESLLARMERQQKGE